MPLKFPLGGRFALNLLKKLKESFGYDTITYEKTEIYGGLFMTEKLYDSDSYIKEFDATVLLCEKLQDNYKIILDKTAFFPTEGGQVCDTGTLDGIPVTDVQTENDIIYHLTPYPIERGKKVHGVIDFEERYRKMQNHSGEHIICGIAHRLHGCENVGFHLGSDYVTMDLDKPLTEEQIREIEILANNAVYANAQIKAYYPTEKELEDTCFRSKDGITGKVRLVIIDGFDICACCAPHVARTGEIGIIKILDWINYKGGVRLNILCGIDALRDYHERYKRNLYISNILSSKQEDVCSSVDKLLEAMAQLRHELGEKSKEITRLHLENIMETEESIILFVKDMSSGEIRHLVNGAKEKTKKIAAVFNGSDEEGYSYIIGSRTTDLKAVSSDLNNTLNGRGGGNAEMIQGNIHATVQEIRDYIQTNF